MFILLKCIIFVCLLCLVLYLISKAKIIKEFKSKNKLFYRIAQVAFVVIIVYGSQIGNFQVMKTLVPCEIDTTPLEKLSLDNDIKDINVLLKVLNKSKALQISNKSYSNSKRKFQFEAALRSEEQVKDNLRVNYSYYLYKDSFTAKEAFREFAADRLTVTYKRKNIGFHVQLVTRRHDGSMDGPIRRILVKNLIVEVEVMTYNGSNKGLIVNNPLLEVWDNKPYELETIDETINETIKKLALKLEKLQ